MFAHAIAVVNEDRGRADPKAPSDAGSLQLHGEMAALVLVISPASVEVHHLGIISTSSVHICNCLCVFLGSSYPPADFSVSALIVVSQKLCCVKERKDTQQTTMHSVA